MSEQQGGTAWLRRNAREIDYDAVRGENPWERAKEAAISAASQAVTAREDGEPVEGRWRVALSNSDRVHDVLLLKAPNGDYAGSCDCEGYVKGGHTCAHLCFVRMRESVGDLEVPEPSDEFVEVFEESASEEDVEAAVDAVEVPGGDGIGMPIESSQNGQQAPERETVRTFAGGVTVTVTVEVHPEEER